jgi:hypothetical protein
MSHGFSILGKWIKSSLDETVERTYDYFAHLTPTERLAKAGVLSKAFWLADTIQKTERRLQPNPQ